MKHITDIATLLSFVSSPFVRLLMDLYSLLLGKLQIKTWYKYSIYDVMYFIIFRTELIWTHTQKLLRKTVYILCIILFC